MISTILSFPAQLEEAISNVLNTHGNAWLKRAEILHKKYMEQDKNKPYIQDFDDALSYLALRSPATYAQAQGVFSQVLQTIPHFKPKSLLDIGSGCGSVLWAANSAFPGIESVKCIDMDKNLLALGKQIAPFLNTQIDTRWEQKDLKKGLGENNHYDVVVIANVLNELSVSDSEKVVGQAFNICSGVLIIIEPGTPFGSSIVESVSQKMADAGYLLAPYISNSFVRKNNFWLHFSQKFTRPEFQRRVRKYLRDDSLMASDVEDAKYSYVAISKIPAEINPYARVVGPIEKQKGFLEVPLLTKETIEKIKVMKRHKEQYNTAKELKWGQIIQNKRDLSVVSKNIDNPN